MTRGQKIRAKREELGLTQRQLAEDMGFSSGNVVVDMEADKAKLSEPRQKLVARLLGIPVEQLKDDPEPEALGQSQPEESISDQLTGALNRALALSDQIVRILEGAKT